MELAPSGACWRIEFGFGTCAEFLPVHMAPELSAAVMIAGSEGADRASVAAPRNQSRIEVRLAGGTRVVIEGMAAPAVITATLKALG